MDPTATHNLTPVDVARLLALATLWGGSYLFIRVAVPGFGPASLVLVRVVLGALLLIAYARATRKPVSLRPYAGRLVVLGFLNAAFPYLLISAAELHLTASFAALLSATVPLFAAAYSATWLGERLTVARMTGLLTGMIGVGMMVGWSAVPITGPMILAVVATLAASASYAGAAVFTQLRLRGVPTHILALGQQLGALVWVAVPGIVAAPRVVPPAAAILSVLALGALSTALAYLLFFTLLERIGPTRTSTLTYLVPIVGLLWGVVLLHEPVNTGMMLGLGVVLSSVVLVNGVRLGAFHPLRVPWRNSS
ncbi:MAG TPA: DMT family transporter [Gemmatimonadales bacterium]|jgi:drug/metabolite transporter (DMT)-like permease